MKKMKWSEKEKEKESSRPGTSYIAAQPRSTHNRKSLLRLPIVHRLGEVGRWKADRVVNGEW